MKRPILEGDTNKRKKLRKHIEELEKYADHMEKHFYMRAMMLDRAVKLLRTWRNTMSGQIDRQDQVHEHTLLFLDDHRVLNQTVWRYDPEDPETPPF